MTSSIDPHPSDPASLQCPLPMIGHSEIQLAHGGGGKLMHELIDKLIAPAFANPWLDARHDGAILSFPNRRLAFTTDSYVVSPPFFPGGDIGSLAVFGTVNDLAMCGARPLYLSAAFILEEGFPMESLRRVIESMRRAADLSQLVIVTGDTKVVDRGKGDGIYINTAGLGVLEHDLEIGPGSVQAGDQILLSGDIGRHGVAVLATREGLAFETPVESDCAPVAGAALALLRGGIRVRCMRDLTRGGLASALNEIAQSRGVDLEIRESDVPLSEPVRGACEVLGLDPFYVANEGRFVAFIAPDEASAAIRILKGAGLLESTMIGEVCPAGSGLVTVKNTIGTRRILDLPWADPLPRIC